MFSQSLLQLRWRLKFGFLLLPTLIPTGTRVASGGTTFGFGLVETCDYALIMCLDNIFRDSFHTKDFDFETLPVGQRVVNARESLLVNLIHMYREASCSI
jgi:hypothetical protein